MKRIFMLSIIMAMVLVFSIQAQANLKNLSLGSISYRLIYDTDPDIAWYDYTNASGTWQNHMDLASRLFIDSKITTYDDLKPSATLDGSLSNSQNQEWKFSIYIGQQMNFIKNDGNYDIAVRNRDAVVTEVPEAISSTNSWETVVFAFHKAF